MRRPRDLDAELQALEQKAKALKERKARQLGELVTATGADALDVEVLAGALLTMMDSVDPARKERWRNRGQAFFQRRTRGAGNGVGSDHESGSTGGSGETPA